MKDGIIRRLEFKPCGMIGDDEEHAREALARCVDESLRAHDKLDPSTKHQAMILAQSIRTLNGAEAMVQCYNRLFPGKATAYHSGSGNATILENFRSGKIQVLVVVGKLLEGFDHKPVSVLGIARNVAQKSRVLFTQFVGRAVRKVSHENENISAIVCAHVQHSQEHNFSALDSLADCDPSDEDDDE